MSRFVDPATLDVLDRLSRSSLARHEHEQEHIDVLELSPGYHDAQTPGEAGKTKLPVIDKRWLGLIVHSTVVGFVSSVLPLTVFPFLTSFLNMEGTQTLSTRTLFAMPWVLRPFYGILIDCMPFASAFRQRLFLGLGWVICAGALIGAHFVPKPDPYFRDRAYAGEPLAALNATQQSTITKDAQSQGAIYILLMTIATIGYVLADVAADMLAKDVSRNYFPALKEDEDCPLVISMTMKRYLAMLFSFLFMGVGMSGPDYGGDFGFTLDISTLMLIIGIISALPILFAFTAIEERPRSRRSTRTSFRNIWLLFNNRAVNYVIACRFVGGIFGGISAIAGNPIALYWAHVQPLNDNVVSFVATGVVLLVLRLADKRGWNINFRITVIVATVIILILDCGATMFTIWNVVRSQWFWIGLPVMEALPSSLDYVILTIILSEIAEPGSEDLMRSLITSVAFLAGPFGVSLTKYIDAQFDVTNQDIMSDTTTVRTHATLVFLIAYVCQLLSLAWLLALPRNGQEAREWKKRSGTSRGHAIVVILLLLASFVWSITVHVLSVNQSTSCLEIAGGKGC
ncbi:hypothetical protein Poli38472_010298 [Pythium oligandrum]|uniref:Transmembrane protein n=1 Tax=Pythium oligandrum TaxID=41045 RepID=A0A8K1FF85_PYTOL|nr:hypothetical protein Poli38472_010298 [Pythium oligandrum]|eukprot:TMW58739.1 hypothetical protein Poli38472_010298 [Pythium oligandrum]